MEVEINGIRYRNRKQKPMATIRPSVHSALIMASAFASFDPYYKKRKEPPRVDIVKEYELIQNKESRLSRSRRDWVVDQFEKNFERILE